MSMNLIYVTICYETSLGGYVTFFSQNLRFRTLVTKNNPWKSYKNGCGISIFWWVSSCAGQWTPLHSSTPAAATSFNSEWPHEHNSRPLWHPATPGHKRCKTQTPRAHTPN